jgi:hypothetical protein
MIPASELTAGDFIKVGSETLRLHRVPVRKDAEMSVGFIKKGTKGNNIGNLILQPNELVEVVARWPEMAGGWKV